MLRLQPFRDELPIPDLVHPLAGDARGGYLAIAARAMQVKLHAALPAASVWSYRLDEGTVVRRGAGTLYLGPTVEVQRADVVTVDWKNAIPVAATLPYRVSIRWSGPAVRGSRTAGEISSAKRDKAGRRGTALPDVVLQTSQGRSSPRRAGL